jgi:hypothetical protein
VTAACRRSASRVSGLTSTGRARPKQFTEARACFASLRNQGVVVASEFEDPEKMGASGFRSVISVDSFGTRPPSLGRGVASAFNDRPHRS